MQFIPFPESNRALGRPAGMTDEECGTLHVYTDGVSCISCWQPTEQERQHIAAGLPIWLGVRCNQPTQPPVWLSAIKPEMPKEAFRLFPEIEDAIAQFAKRLPDPSFAGKAPQLGSELRRLNPELRQYHDDRHLDLGQLYFVSSDEIQQAHLVAMRQAYRQGGKPALVDYLKPYKYFIDAPNTLPIA